VTAAMNTNDLESDAVVLLRLARAWLSRDVISVHIDATGIAITVATEDAAQRIIEAHGLRRLRRPVRSRRQLPSPAGMQDLRQVQGGAAVRLARAVRIH
jgi:hypothetical protein